MYGLAKYSGTVVTERVECGERSAPSRLAHGGPYLPKDIYSLESLGYPDFNILSLATSNASTRAPDYGAEAQSPESFNFTVFSMNRDPRTYNQPLPYSSYDRPTF